MCLDSWIRVRNATAYILGLVLLCSAGEFKSTEWKKVSAQRLSEKQLDSLNWSDKEYEVNLVAGKIHFSKPSKRTDNTKLVSNGRLVAADDGEFGGGLFQYFEKGKGSRKIIDGNFHSFFDFQGKTFVLDGLAHLGINRGKIWNIYEMNGVWHLGKSIDVHESPYAYCVKDESAIYLVTPESLLEVNLKTSVVKPIIKNAFWGGLYPNSIVRESDTSIWIGMRGGILNIQGVSSETQLWFERKSKP